MTDLNIFEDKQQLLLLFPYAPIARGLREMLEGDEYSVILARNVSESITFLEKSKIRAVLLDEQIVIDHGFPVLQQLLDASPHAQVFIFRRPPSPHATARRWDNLSGRISECHGFSREEILNKLSVAARQ
jgi:DNA-binding NtrC family response regulator